MSSSRSSSSSKSPSSTLSHSSGSGSGPGTESPPRRAETIQIGGVAPTRGESQRTILPVLIRKHAYLSVVAGSRKYAEIDLDCEVTTIGRGPDVDFVLEEPAASRKHVAIAKTSEGHVLRDLGSTNGTYLKGVLNGKERLLEDDDCFRIGGTEIVYHVGRPSD